MAVGVPRTSVAVAVTPVAAAVAPIRMVAVTPTGADAATTAISRETMPAMVGVVAAVATAGPMWAETPMMTRWRGEEAAGAVAVTGRMVRRSLTE